MSERLTTLQVPGLGLGWYTLWGQGLATLVCSR